MTAEQLEELHHFVDRVDSDDIDAHDGCDPYWTASLARKVIAAEKLVDEAEYIMHGLIVNDSWSNYEVNKLLSEITAYREASK